MMQEEKRLLTELLQLYRDFPCLWDQTHVLYNNREAREQALNVILEKYKAIHEDATVEILKKKIENMRATYRREHKKVLAAKVNGLSEYRPTLWYYKLFTFLHDGTADDYSMSETNVSENDDQDDHDKELQEEYHSDYEQEEEPKPKKPKMSIMYLRDQGNNEDYKNVNSHSFTHDNSETEAFGKSVGLQLRELNPIQKTIAEKLISDIIFHGRINALNLKTSININGNDYVIFFILS